MKINWKVRVKNKMFWIAIVSALLMLGQVVAGVFGFELNLGAIGDKLIAVVNAIFGVLAILGVVADPTTAGMSDSTQAMSYEKPKEE